MLQHVVVVIDQGTTGTRVFLFNRQGQPIADAYAELRQHYPQSGWVEHDANEIWSAALLLMNELLLTHRVAPNRVAAIGITNQRETIVVWDRHTGEPLHRAIVWQCRRSADICERLIADGAEAQVKQKTGLRLDPYFSGSKIAWLNENAPAVKKALQQGDALVGTIDSWLIYKLSGGESHVTDVSNASRTLLFNINDMQWDDDLTAMFGVPPASLPQVRPSSGALAHTAAHGALPAGVPIAGVAGDQQAALFGQLCFEPGMAKNTYGTGCFMLMPTGDTPVHCDEGLLTTVAWQLGHQVTYALEGSVFVAGAAVQWLRDGLQIIPDAPATEALAESVADTGGVYFVPAFVGLGAPYWDAHARGIITGISGGTKRAHIVRAALEAIAYQTKDVLDIMSAACASPLKTLRVDGGASANRFLMQYQADVLNIPVERPHVLETTALGAFYLAGLGIGWWDGMADLARLASEMDRFEPQGDAARNQQAYRGWLQAIARARSNK